VAYCSPAAGHITSLITEREVSDGAGRYSRPRRSSARRSPKPPHNTRWFTTASRSTDRHALSNGAMALPSFAKRPPTGKMGAIEIVNPVADARPLRSRLRAWRRRTCHAHLRVSMTTRRGAGNEAVDVTGDLSRERDRQLIATINADDADQIL